MKGSKRSQATFVTESEADAAGTLKHETPEQRLAACRTTVANEIANAFECYGELKALYVQYEAGLGTNHDNVLLFWFHTRICISSLVLSLTRLTDTDRRSETLVQLIDGTALCGQSPAMTAQSINKFRVLAKQWLKADTTLKELTNLRNKCIAHKDRGVKNQLEFSDTACYAWALVIARVFVIFHTLSAVAANYDYEYWTDIARQSYGRALGLASNMAALELERVNLETDVHALNKQIRNHAQKLITFGKDLNARMVCRYRIQSELAGVATGEDPQGLWKECYLEARHLVRDMPDVFTTLLESR